MRVGPAVPRPPGGGWRDRSSGRCGGDPVVVELHEVVRRRDQAPFASAGGSAAALEAFDRAVEKVTEAAQELLETLVTNAPPRDREIEAVKAKARAAERFSTPAISSAGD